MSTGTDLAADVASTLKELSLSSTITHSQPGTYSPGGTTSPAVTITTYTGNCVLVRYSDQELAGTSIVRSDRKAILGLLTPAYTPVPNDTLTYNGVTYQVIHVDIIELQGVLIAFICQVRAGT